MFKKKKFMAYLATVLLLVVSMIMTACGGPADTKKDAAQSGKQIEITDVTGQKVTLKKTCRTRSSSIECFWWGLLDYGCIARQRCG